MANATRALAGKTRVLSAAVGVSLLLVSGLLPPSSLAGWPSLLENPRAAASALSPTACDARRGPLSPALAPTEAGGGTCGAAVNSAGGSWTPGAWGMDSAPWSPNRTLAWSTVPAPPFGAGEGAGLAADSVGGDAILFGGQTGSALSSRTQQYNESNGTWSVLPPSASPSARSYFAFAADSPARLAVLFGGVVNASSLRVDNATWTYQFATGTWTNVSKAVAPAPREDAAFTIDPAAGFGLLYGGWNQDYSPTSSITYSDLWRFNLSTEEWSPVAVTGSAAPPPLQGATFTWDPAVDRFDLFGGCYPCSSEIWQFNPVANEWNALPTPSGTVPTPREDGSWTWDPSASVDVLFGGTDGLVRFNDTFEYFPLANRWVEETPPVAPSPRFAPASAWLNVSGNQTLVLSGGNTSPPLSPDFWRLAPTSNLTFLAINESSLLPLAAANISVDGAPGQLTDAHGYLNLTQLVASETSVNVTRLGYHANASTFWLPPASSTSMEYRLSPVPPARLEIRVIDPVGLPIGNVSVNVTVDGEAAPGSPTGTDPAGYANFTDVPSEIPVPSAVVRASAPENYTSSASISIPPGSADAAALTLVPYPRIDLHVMGLLANLSLVPVHRATVTEDGLNLGSTLSTGWLNATSLLPGEVGLVVDAEGFDPATQSVDLPTEGNITVSITLTGEPFGLLQVTVREAATGDPIAGAAVRATSVSSLSSVDTSRVAFTNVSGLTLLTVPQGGYQVSASAYGYVATNTSTPVEVLSGGTVNVTLYLILLPGATVDVLVHAADTGAPLASARVAIGRTSPGFTDGNGWANFTNVHFGNVFVNVSHPGYFNNSTEVDLAPFEVVPELLVNLTPGISQPGNTTGPGPFGGFPPSLGSLWPYLVAFAVMLLGAAAYLFYLRTPRPDGRRPATPQTAGPPAPSGERPAQRPP